jgi:mRNA-degrading endonuclease YafQ of YafQ-DinJ toxin-antitoxin module
LRSINWTDKSLQSFKRIIRQDQYAITKFKPRLARTLRQLQKDPFHPNLKTHKLIGDLSDVWSCSVDGYDHNKCQILFEFIQGIGVWKKLKQKMDERHIKRCPNIGHEKSKH